MDPSSNLVGPAVQAARRALRRLDDEELSPGLRRVAASSARRLPPPLLASLVTELDSSEWLRERALEEFQPGQGRAAEASELFLRRPEGWEVRLSELERGETERAIERREAELERENRRLRSRVETLESELAAQREAAQRAAQEADRQAEAELTRLRDRVGELRTMVDRLEHQQEERRAETERLRSELEEADARIGDLRDALLRARRSPSGDGEEMGRAFGRGSPIETARTLDQLQAALTAAIEGAPRPAPTVEPLALPGGVRPDRPEAIEWLLALEQPVALLVDGWNVAHQLTARPDPTTRTRVAAALSRIRRLAEAPIAPVLFWDSSIERDRRAVSGVDIRYVPSADHAIVEAVGDRTVVVTGDREVREGAEARGAVGLWASALAAWMER